MKEVRDKGGELREINLLDKGSDIWGELHDVMAGLCKQHAEETMAAAVAVAAAAALTTSPTDPQQQAGAGMMPAVGPGRPSKRAKTTPGGLSTGCAPTPSSSSQDMVAVGGHHMESVDSLGNGMMRQGMMAAAGQQGQMFHMPQQQGQAQQGQQQQGQQQRASTPR